MKPLIVAVLTSFVLAAAATAHAAELTVDPQQRCYREQQTVFLPGTGFTPNAQVDFSVDGVPLEVTDPVEADPAGNLTGTSLKLRSLISGQQRVSYVATDTADMSNVAQIDLLVTATTVGLRPLRGPPNRRLRISARGFFGGSTLYAHIRRDRSRRVRTERIGRVRGACRKVQARRRLFTAGAPAGRYTIQFDTLRRYREERDIEFEYNVTISARR